MRGVLILPVVCLFSAGALKAEEILQSGFDYSQAHIRYISGELDSGTTGNGVEFELSYDFHGLVFSLHVLKLEYPGVATTLGPQTHVGGIGGYIVLAKDADLYGSVQHGLYDLDSTGAKLADSDLTILTLGIRRRITKEAELQIYAGRYDYSTNTLTSADDIRDQTVFGIRGIVYAPDLDVFGMNAGIEVFDTYQHFGLGLTIEF